MDLTLPVCPSLTEKKTDVDPTLPYYLRTSAPGHRHRLAQRQPAWERAHMGQFLCWLAGEGNVGTGSPEGKGPRSVDLNVAFSCARMVQRSTYGGSVEPSVGRCCASVAFCVVCSTSHPRRWPGSTTLTIDVRCGLDGPSVGRWRRAQPSVRFGSMAWTRASVWPGWATCLTTTVQ